MANELMRLRDEAERVKQKSTRSVLLDRHFLMGGCPLINSFDNAAPTVQRLHSGNVPKCQKFEDLRAGEYACHVIQHPRLHGLAFVGS